jgi:hypothetical protein
LPGGIRSLLQNSASKLISFSDSETIDISNENNPSLIPTNIDSNESLAGACAVTMPNGLGLLIGGAKLKLNGFAFASQPADSFLTTFDPKNNQFSSVSASGTGPSRRWGVACAIISTKVFVFGGCDPATGSSPTDSNIYILDTTSFSWTQTSSSASSSIVPGPLCFASATMYSNNFIVTGGQGPVASVNQKRDGPTSSSSTLFAFNIDQSTWIDITNINSNSVTSSAASTSTSTSTSTQSIIPTQSPQDSSSSSYSRSTIIIIVKILILFFVFFFYFLFSLRNN